MANYRGVSRTPTMELLRNLLTNVSTLFDREVELVKIETREMARETFVGAGKVLVGALLALIALVSLVTAGILAMALFLPGWVAGLIAFAVFGIAAAIVLWLGKSELQAVFSRPLEHSRESVKEDLEWARHRLTSNER